MMFIFYKPCQAKPPFPKLNDQIRGCNPNPSIMVVKSLKNIMISFYGHTNWLVVYVVDLPL